MKKVFETKDLVVPMLTFPDPCPVKVEITDDFVFLFVGQRDWQWRISDGSFVGSGCGVCASVEPPNTVSSGQEPE